MSAKWTLDVNNMQDDFFSDTALIGIACSMLHHKFCWTLNNYFDIDLVREPELDIQIKSASGNEVFFPIYQYHFPVGGGRYLIYKLKNGDDFLLQEVKQLDYLWLVQGNNADASALDIIQKLRNLSDVQLAQLIAPERLKNLNHLLI